MILGLLTGPAQFFTLRFIYHTDPASVVDLSRDEPSLPSSPGTVKMDSSPPDSPGAVRMDSSPPDSPGTVKMDTSDEEDFSETEEEKLIEGVEESSDRRVKFVESAPDAKSLVETGAQLEVSKRGRFCDGLFFC